MLSEEYAPRVYDGPVSVRVTGGERTYDGSMDPDARYARGEITRDEWMRLKASPPGGAPPPQAPGPAPPRPAGRSGLALFLVVVIVIVVAVALAAVWWGTRSGFAGWNPSYAEPMQIHVSDLAVLNASATQGRAYAGNNSLWFGSGSGSLMMVVYGSPADHDMAFVIQGMVNPTVHVAAGTHIVLTMVNMDAGEYHTWSLTTQAPPYGSSGMMGGGMMSGTMMGTSSLAPMSSMGMWSQQMTMTAVSGTYWYVCAVSNHAASGMYGQLVVG